MRIILAVLAALIAGALPAAFAQNYPLRPVRLIVPVPPGGGGLGPEHMAIIELSGRPQSVAEISAHLDLPVGIVRVLLGDLLDGGFILVREPRRTNAHPSEPVLKAVISGLRSL